MHTYHLKGRDYRTGKPLGVTVKDQLITNTYPLPEDNASDLPFIAPGLVDLQVNGFLSIDFNAPETSVDNIRELTEALYKEGVTTYYPTLITNATDVIHTEIDRITAACRQYPEVAATIGGIHLEGPFISPEAEPRGAHALPYIQAPDWWLFSQWQDRARGMIRLITLSPEWDEAPAFIERCVHSGVRVAIGHTAASPTQIAAAVKAGARLSTHFGNGAHLMISRRDHYFWEQLAQDDLWMSIIADGFHISDALTHVILKVKPKQTILVSDSTRFAGAAPGRYASHIGGNVILSADGRLSMEDNPALLAGAAHSILFGVETLVRKKQTSLAEAWDMASVRPVALMHGGAARPYGLTPGASADLVLFEVVEEKARVLKTMKGGRVVFEVG